MISIAQLWLPILLAAVGVFVASSLIHMVFKWHGPDYRKFANEDDVRRAINAASAAPGQYMIPYCSDPKDMGKPEAIRKFTEGPVGFVTLRKPAAPKMGPFLGQWFVLNLAVALAAGYLAARTLPAGASFAAVCRVVGVVTMMSYAVGSLSHAIWMGKPWMSAAKEILDALIYGLVSGAVFAWLWPR